jgi:hypothetical protein
MFAALTRCAQLSRNQPAPQQTLPPAKESDDVAV